MIPLGGCAWSDHSVSLMYKYGCGEVKRDIKKVFTYLQDLERSGNGNACVLAEIGNCYHKGHGCVPDLSLAKYYYQRAIDLGYTPACSLYVDYTVWLGGADLPGSMNTAVLKLLEAEKKGIAIKDDRILSRVINYLLMSHYTPSPEVLGTFKDKVEMLLYYCDVLINRGSPLGYQHKGDIYISPVLDVPEDKSKAVSIWEEADRLGLADNGIYLKLAEAYSYVLSLALYFIYLEHI